MPMSQPMIPRERCEFSAIVDRPPLKLPGNNRVVIWTIVNYEVWDINKPMARQVLPAPTGVPLLPDVPNWSWHEYGMRVGVWRFFELFKRHKITPTLAINARVCEDYARVAQEAKNDGWEFMGLENVDTYISGTAGCMGIGATPGQSVSYSMAVFRK